MKFHSIIEKMMTALKSKKIKITIIITASLLFIMLAIYGITSALKFVNNEVENPYNTIEDICKEKLNYDQEKDKLITKLESSNYIEDANELIEIYNITIYESTKFGPNLYFNYKIEIQYEYNIFLRNIGIENIKNLIYYKIYREAK